MTIEPIDDGSAALAEGRWSDARRAFEALHEAEETADSCFGLAMALWWLGENHESVATCSRAYALFRQSGEVQRAAECAVWLAIAYKANFANSAAANGWISRAERLLEPLEPGPLHGWVWVARAYRLADLDTAEELTERAGEVARASGDVDLELVALAQLGLVRVGKGHVEAGFALIDEAMAAVLAGERSTLDTVVYACCDMLNACELASDLERAMQWCQVADDFVARYGCPFLYAECRIYYGSVLTAKGRWEDAERELGAGLRITEGACPSLHRRAMARLAGLRVRQGRVDEAEMLLASLGPGVDADADATLLAAALSLVRGDAPTAGRLLEHRLRHRENHQRNFASVLGLLVEAYVASDQLDAATGAAQRLAAAADSAASSYLSASAATAQGRTLLAHGDTRGVAHLETALETWSAMALPLEAARTRLELARALAGTEPEAAVDHARRALTTFEDLGASIDTDRAAAFLRSVGVAARTGAKGVGVLTVHEREVLQLLGAGLSNPEIAERLFISRKTASHHVSNILSKLGVRNRAEAAARAVTARVDGEGAASVRRD